MESKEQAVNLDGLIKQLREIFDNDKVDIDQVKQLMSTHRSNPKEWRKYAHFDRHRYTRNLIDTGNGKYNLILICWSPGQGSGIHDHANSHCFMKMMSGSLLETQFAWPENSEIESETNFDEGSELKAISKTTFKCDQVAYINDTIGLHRVENPSHVEPAVSLHLYAPPINKCHVYDQRTGKSTLVSCTFFSESGVRTPFKVTEKKGFLTFESKVKNDEQHIIDTDGSSKTSIIPA